MSRFIPVLCLSICLAAVSVAAQQIESDSGVEIGTFFGLSHLRFDQDGVSGFGVPVAPSLEFDGLSFFSGSPSIYAIWSPDESFSFGSEFSFGHYGHGEESVTALYLAVRGAFHLRAGGKSDSYLWARGSIFTAEESDYSGSASLTEYGLGAGLGYRWRVGSGLIVRAEGGYRRWLSDPPVNGFSLLLGLGSGAGRISPVENTRSSEVEIGTLFGFSQIGEEDGDGHTSIGAPVSAVFSSILENPSIYISWFLDERFSISPEFGLGRASGGRENITSLYLAGRGAFHPRGGSASGVYGFGRVALRAISWDLRGESDSVRDSSLGAGLGYRWRVGNGLVVRAEGGYRRWFDDKLNEFSVLLGLGACIGGN